MGHFYEKLTGEPRYFVDGRDATVRDARKYGWVPSVNEVKGIISAPALTNYFVKQAIMSSLTLPKIDGEADDAWIDRIISDSKATAKAAADNGTEIHDAIELAIKSNGCEVSRKYEKHVTGALEELFRLFPEVDDWVAEKCFSHPLGFGGKCDLHSPSTGIVVDWKSKDGDFSDGKKLAWDQNIQLAAYQVGLGLVPSANSLSCIYIPPNTVTAYQRCANIFVSRTHPGKVASHVWTADEIAHGWAVFEAALALWKRLKKFDPSW